MVRMTKDSTQLMKIRFWSSAFHMILWFFFFFFLIITGCYIIQLCWWMTTKINVSYDRLGSICFYSKKNVNQIEIMKIWNCKMISEKNGASLFGAARNLLNDMTDVTDMAYDFSWYLGLQSNKRIIIAIFSALLYCIIYIKNLAYDLLLLQSWSSRNLIATLASFRSTCWFVVITI